MANLTAAEKQMFTSYYGDEHLENNDDFWTEVIVLYMDRDVTLPVIDNHINRRWLAEMLDCPPGKCGLCCTKYTRLHLTDIDLARLPEVEYQTDEKGKFIDISKDCPFMKDRVCTVWDKRPDVCMQFPTQSSIPHLVEGKAINFLGYRIKCPASVNVIRKVMTQAVSGEQMLLPDLSIINRRVNETDNDKQTKDDAC